MILKRKRRSVMKRVVFAFVVMLVMGCAAYVTPEGTYIEPLPDTIVIGPPAIVAPPPAVVVRPLPSVVIVPGRSLYFYGGFYYYNWDRGWYWSRQRRGPWHVLPRDRWPSKMERREDGRERYRERDRH
jgi:hypothetical protein